MGSVKEAEIARMLANPSYRRVLCKRSKLLFGSLYFKGFKRLLHQNKWLKSFEYLRHLQISPRTHGKSLIFVELLPIWSICNIPNVRILIASKSAGQAIKRVAVIRNHLLFNKAIRENYGDVYLEGGQIDTRFGKSRWTQNQIYVKRDTGIGLADPTVEAIGILGAITGAHFDIIILDDILDDENTRTPKQRGTTENWFFGTICQLAEPHTKIYVIGTRKHYLDLYGKILKNPVWHNTVEKAIIKYPNNWEAHFRNPKDYPREDLQIVDDKGVVVDVRVKGTHKVLAPELWNIKRLLLDRIGIGSIIFEREKQNNPSSEHEQDFDINWLEYYTDLPKNLYFVQSVDIATSQKHEADFFVVLTIGIDNQNNIYLVNYKRVKTKFPEQLNIIKAQAALYNPQTIVVESTSAQIAWVQQLEAETSLPVEPVSHLGRNKIARIITTLSPVCEAHKLYVRKDMHEFLDEYENFPQSIHKDIMDALEMAVCIVLRNRPLVAQYRISSKFKTTKIKRIFVPQDAKRVFETEKI